MQFSEGMVVVRDGSASVVVDTRAWPIVIASWFGAPTETLVDRYFDQHANVIARAQRTRQRFILISDTFASERPSATARKRIADRTAAQGEAVELTLASFIVIENALIRGAVTALRWIMPSMDDNQIVDGIGRAIDGALAALDAAGVARPAGFHASSYQRPRP